MSFIHLGELFLERSHIELLQKEESYVRLRYHAIVMAKTPGATLSKRALSKSIGLKPRHFNRLIDRFENDGIAGLRRQSRRPHRFPRKIPDWLEIKIVKVRVKTGFGSYHIAVLVNKSLEIERIRRRVNKTTVYRALVRRGQIEAEKKAKIKWKRFEWGHPNRLIQADLTTFNTIPILTSEDDHSRKGWAIRLPDTYDKTVVKGMKYLLKMRYDNLLTDNGSQFSRKNAEMRKYCQENINEKHIWASIHHPQTLGKLSAFQKALKAFLFQTVHNSRDKHLIDHNIEVFVSWYNNGRFHQGIEDYPETRYSGKRNEDWYNSLVKGLKLEEVLSLA
jgi:transposase InsO family protein